jgi:hypothetical protein
MTCEQEFVWITKYALTKGILRMPLKRIVQGHMAVVRGLRNDEYFHGLEWHLDERLAIETAESMRARKIIALGRKLDKLQKLRFDASPAVSEPESGEQK